MTTKLYNLARMTTATTGTGTITLGSAVSGYLTFALAGVQNGEIVSYGIRDGANSEVGVGTYTSSGTTLSRTVRNSTNSDSAISLSGTAEVYITALVESFWKSIQIQEKYAQNTAAPTITSGAFRTRVLNTIQSDETGVVTVGSSQVTLPAGTYRVFATCPAIRVGRHQGRLQDITNTATLLIGTSEYSASGGSYLTSSVSIVSGSFTLSGTTVIELQHRTEVSDVGGIANNFTNEIYATLSLIKTG